MAEKGMISYEDVISKTAELQDNKKLEDISNAIEYLGDSSVEKLFGAEVEKVASGEFTGNEAAQDVMDWVLS